MTECKQEVFSFTAHFSLGAEAGFTAGQVSSDLEGTSTWRCGSYGLLVYTAFATALLA